MHTIYIQETPKTAAQAWKESQLLKLFYYSRHPVSLVYGIPVHSVGFYQISVWWFYYSCYSEPTGRKFSKLTTALCSRSSCLHQIAQRVILSNTDARAYFGSSSLKQHSILKKVRHKVWKEVYHRLNTVYVFNLWYIFLIRFDIKCIEACSLQPVEPKRTTPLQPIHTVVLLLICRHGQFLPRKLHLHEDHFDKKPYFYHYYLPYKDPSCKNF